MKVTLNANSKELTINVNLDAEEFEQLKLAMYDIAAESFMNEFTKEGKDALLFFNTMFRPVLVEKIK